MSNVNDGGSEFEIAHLGLSVRARKAIHFLGIKTVEQLCAAGVEKLRSAPNVGNSTIKEIADALSIYGLGLVGPVPPESWMPKVPSLRDYFAAKAMAGIMQSPIVANDRDDAIKRCAQVAYKVADAMLAAREAQ